MALEDSPSGNQKSLAPEAIRGHVRLAGHQRVSHGLFLPMLAGVAADDQIIRELNAWLLVLPQGAAFTHVTGAMVLGWQLPRLPKHVPVFAAVEGNPTRPQRPALICSRLVRPSNTAMVRGVPVEAPEEILLRAARDFGLLDLVILVDSARRAGHIDARRMADILASKRPGVRMLRLAWSLSDHRADSGPETVLRLFHVVIDVCVEPQAVLVDQDGRVIGNADLLVVGTTFLHEYDGDVHRESKTHRVDLRRERGLNDTAYRRYGYSLDDLLNHPLAVMHEIDRRLGRPHRVAPLRRWQRLVENSLYAERGRERVLNRWRRHNTLIDWSRTA